MEYPNIKAPEQSPPKRVKIFDLDQIDSKVWKPKVWIQKKWIEELQQAIAISESK